MGTQHSELSAGVSPRVKLESKATVEMSTVKEWPEVDPGRSSQSPESASPACPTNNGHPCSEVGWGQVSLGYVFSPLQSDP